MQGGGAGIGERIAELRGTRSQREIALAAGMDPTALNKVESGKRQLRLSELVSLASVLGIDARDLLSPQEPTFSLRADAGPEVREARERCCSLVEGYRTLIALTGS